MRMLVLSAICALLVPEALAGSPGTGTSNQFKDWAIACDQAVTCSAVLLPGPDPASTDERDSDDGFMLIQRQAGPVATATLGVDIDPAARNQMLTFLVDDRPVLTVPAAALAIAATDHDSLRATLRDPAAAAVVIAATANGSRLTLRAGDRKLASLSLAGLSATLRFMDAVQQRAGTVTALVAKGSKPATAVPQPPPSAVVHRAPAPSGPLPEAELKRLAAIVRHRLPPEGGPDECNGLNESQSPDSFTASGFALSPQLAVIALRCSISGAYNEVDALFAIDRRSFAPGPLIIEDLPGLKLVAMAAPGVPELWGIEFDPRRMTLSSLGRGRHLSDCGSYAEFTWDGTKFVPTLYRAMGVCRHVSPQDWPVTWRVELR